MSVVFFDGVKGGIGKSTMCGAYGEYLESKKIPFAVIECDTQNADVKRFFEGRIKTVLRVNLRDEISLVELANYFDELEETDIIVSLPAGIGTRFNELALNLIDRLKGTNRHGAVVWVLGRTHDSINRLMDLQKVIPDDFPIVAARNLYLSGGDPAKFKRWNGSKTKASLVSKGGLEINFPELLDDLFDETFGNNPPKPFSGDGMRYGERMALMDFTKLAFAEFDKVAGYIGSGVR